MTNEELVALIQDGDLNKMADLWANVERLVAWKANRVICAMSGAGGVEFDDLYNSGYLAMSDAVWTYHAGKSLFSTWFMMHLKTTFSVVTGYRTATQRKDPARCAVSLSMSLADDGGVLQDVLADPAGERQLIGVEEQIYRKQLQETMEKALADLPERENCVLRLRYYECFTLEEVSQEMGISKEQIRQYENKGLRRILRGRSANDLLSFLDENYYAGTGLTAFQSRGMSAQEWRLMKMEAAKEREQRRQMEYQKKQLRRELELLACGGGFSTDFKILI